MCPTLKTVSDHSPPFGQIHIPYSSLSAANISLALCFAGLSAVTAFDGDSDMFSSGRSFIPSRKVRAVSAIAACSESSPPPQSVNILKSLVYLQQNRYCRSKWSLASFLILQSILQAEIHTHFFILSNSPQCFRGKRNY